MTTIGLLQSGEMVARVAAARAGGSRVLWPQPALPKRSENADTAEGVRLVSVTSAPITGPMVWRGEDLTRSTDGIRAIPAIEVEELDAALCA
jgi:hypothetical protein